MSNGADETDHERDVADSDLPDDVNPEENPLAEGLEPGETAGDLAPGELLDDGKPVDGSDGSGDGDDGDVPAAEQPEHARADLTHRAGPAAARPVRPA